MQGLIIVAMAFFLGLITGVFSRVPNQKKTTGKIVYVEYEYDTDEKMPMYKAIAEYEVNGKMYTIKSKHKSSSFRTGQKVKIAYNSADPQQAKIRPKTNVYVAMMLITAAGIAILIDSFIN